MHSTRTTLALATAVVLLTGCASSSDAEPAPTKTETVTASAPAPAPEPEPEPLALEEQCTEEVAEAAPDWDDWTLKLDGWEDDPKTPDVCKTLSYREYSGAFVEGLDIAAACGTPDELPGKC